MRNIINANIYKTLKSKGYYVVCGLLSMYILMEIYLSFRYTFEPPQVTGIDTLISFLSGPYMVVLLFLIMIGKHMIKDYESGIIKNILGRGITRTKYFIGQIISSYIIVGITWIIFVAILVIIGSIKSGIGQGNIKFILTSSVLNMVFILTLITMLIATIAITRNGIGMVIIFVGAVNIAKIAMFLFSLFNIRLNLYGFEMTTYISAINTQNSINEMLLLKGIGVVAVYFLVSIIVGFYAMKKQDVK